MAVCVCCGDFGALRSMAAGLKVRAAIASNCSCNHTDATVISSHAAVA